MINIGERIIKLRKEKSWSQTDLASEINASRIMIGKYERNESDPSADVLVRLAKVFDVSLDFLVGETTNSKFDKKTLNLLKDIESLPDNERKKIFDYIDLVVRDYKAKQAYS